MATEVQDSINNVNIASQEPTATIKLQEDTQINSPEICIICLDRISEKATLLPCQHDQFDFPCIGTWLQQQPFCPLCKSGVHAVKYNEAHIKRGTRVFHLPAPELPGRPNFEIQRRRNQAQLRSGRSNNRLSPYNSGHDTSDIAEKDRAIAFRKQIYYKRTPSLYVGSNRISGYHNISPSSFQDDANLMTRAKTFIRRELKVFDFLDPSSSAFGTVDRRASNAEFLLEYIVSILKAIDFKGSAGQAEELLKDYLGRGNARLFLHELEAWLRSPYERLDVWDHHVQYGGL